MALFGRDRDVSLFRNINKELLRDVIAQKREYDKFRLEETKERRGYTSDAADERSRVDRGGRSMLQKKKNNDYERA